MRSVTQSLSKHLTNKHLGGWFASRFGDYNLVIFMWDSSRAMNRITKQTGTFGCFEYSTGGNGKIAESVGLLHLNVEDISAATFNHELFHAAQHFLKDRGEEYSAIQFEHCTRDFWKWFYDTFDQEEGANA